jgi:DNA-binding NarL/FixJ family response regulator
MEPVAKVRILIADDHAIVRFGLRALLESRTEWAICAEAKTGREAVDQAKRLRPDVVIMDIRMPELNGLEATRQIVNDLPQTEVLVLTMDTSEEVARIVLRAGARGFVLKSDADSKLVDAVEALSQHKPYLTPAATEWILGDYVDGVRKTASEYSDRLTPREREIIQLLAEGKSNKEVAVLLGIAVKTVEAHRANVMHKLSLHSLGELVRYAIRNKIVVP